MSLTVGIVVETGLSDSKIVDNVVDIEFSERTKLGLKMWVLEGLQNLRYDATSFRGYCIGIVQNLRQTHMI